MADNDINKLHFCELKIDDKQNIERIRLLDGNELSSHAFNSLFLWQFDMKLTFHISDDAFIVKFEDRGDTAYYFPCGSVQGKLSLLNEIISISNLSLHYLREDDVEFLDKHFPNRFLFEETRGDAEYIYNLQDQLELKGKSFKNSRSKIHKAQNSAEWSIYPVNDKNLDLARLVINKWCGSDGSEGDKSVSLLALDYFSELDLIGVLIFDTNGEPVATALGGLITPNTFDLHVTKSIERSLNCLVRFEICKRIPKQAQWINQEEDLNIQGLRDNKLEAHPHHITMLWKGTSI